MMPRYQGNVSAGGYHRIIANTQESTFQNLLAQPLDILASDWLNRHFT